MTTISNCGHDENGKYSGGKAGDQTGGEYCLRAWYNRPWDCVLRHPDAKVRADIAKLAKQAAENDLIGYDQSQRGTFWQQLKAASSYLPANIKTACEADCSSSTAAIVKAVGYRRKNAKLKGVSPDLWTGNMRSALKSAGFEVLTADRYTGQDAYLLPGDILLNESHHVAINVTKGAKAGTESGGAAKADAAASSGTASYRVTAASGLNCRKGAGTQYAVTRVLEYGQTVKVQAVSNGWAKTAKGDYCSAQYIARA